MYQNVFRNGLAEIILKVSTYRHVFRNYSPSTLSWALIKNSCVEFCSMRSTEFLSCMASKTNSHINVHVAIELSCGLIN